MSAIEDAMEMLNDAQAEAVEHVDGPLLVVAGPGTGKTQLLSLRAANILATRDVQPRNILCLTFSNAGAEAMRKRLIELIGREAYGIEVSTFHAFASSIKSRYPEYFLKNPAATAVSDLHASEILDAFLKKLPHGSPLAGVSNGVAHNLGTVKGFISKLKRAGLSPDVYRALMRQNIASADHLESNDELISLASSGIGEGFGSKEEYVARFEELIHAALACAPEKLVKPIVTTPGIYEPYLVWLDKLVSRTELITGNKTDGFRNIRSAVFTNDKPLRAIDRKLSEKALVACDAYEHYQNELESEGLIDYDDMIMDCIAVLETSDELRLELQSQYRYIQVDEFQDTNASQMRIVELLCEGIESPNIMAVGDDDQAIMRFQGASVAYIEQFRDSFQPHNVVLDVNYRSTPEIVGLGMEVAAQVERRLAESVGGKAIHASRDSGDQTEFAEVVFPSPELEYQALARDIRRRIDEGFVESCGKPDEAIAVIARKHDRIKALIPYLIREDVPFSYIQSTSVTAMESMQTLLALLRFVVAYSGGHAGRAEALLPQIVASPELGGDHESSVRFALTAVRRYKGKGGWMKALEESGNPRLKSLHDDLVAWSAKAPAAPVRGLIFEIARRSLRRYAGLQESDPYAYAEFNSGIRALIKFAEDELGTAAKLGRTLRLADVVERLDQSARFNISPDASIDIGAPGAVRLTTAHSAKGLEFDLVYLLDADDGTWHPAKRGQTNLYAPNMLIGDKENDDDHRRLIFVSLTRAKSRLELYRAGESMLQELSGSGEGGGIIGSIAADLVAEDLAEAIQTDWRQSYEFDTPGLLALLKDAMPPTSLSASMLNDFVAYEDGQPASLEFPEKRVLGLPQAPLIHFDFGTIVHAYLEDYMNHVVKGEGADPGELAAARLNEVACMDYRDEDVQQYKQRFERISASFGPWAEPLLTGRIETESKIEALTADGVPLFGICDLMLIDDEGKTIRVVDYKTGKDYPDGEPKPAYSRQLQFYRLLVESSARFEGYRVVACENWYVEPDAKTGEMREPIVASVSDDDLERLNGLVNAVWNRLRTADFDTTEFEESELKAEAIDRGGSKKERSRNLQRAYEQWLIEQDA